MIIVENTNDEKVRACLPQKLGLHFNVKKKSSSSSQIHEGISTFPCVRICEQGPECKTAASTPSGHRVYVRIRIYTK